MDKAVPRPWAPRRCSHGPPGSTDARRAEGTCGGPGQRTSETVRKGSSHKKSERAGKYRKIGPKRAEKGHFIEILEIGDDHNI